MELSLKFAVIVIALGVASSEKTLTLSSPTLTAPSEIFAPVSKENTRFSRLLHQNAAALQFSSISNLAPPISGIAKDLKEVKEKNQKKKANLSSKHLGRRTLDYDDTESFDENGHPNARIITEPQPGNEYVYIRQGGIQTEEQQAAAASVTSINRQPARIPFTLLRQSNGKRVNISPVFSTQEQSSDFDNPIFHPQNDQAVPSEREYELASEDTTTTVEGVDAEVTTSSSLAVEGDEPEHREMIVNVVTSKPRVEFENQNKTTSKPVVLETNAFEADQPNPTADLKENFLVQSTRRIGSFPDFEDSPTRLQTAESNAQPARVNVRPASSGKEYEYEYIYYYYDDDDEDNSTSKVNGTKAQGSGKGSTSGLTPTPVPARTKVESDFDDEELEEFEDEEVPEVVKPSSTPVKSPEPVKAKAPVVEKFSNSNPINQLDRSRSPKQAFASEKTEKVAVPEVDYKLESGDFQQYEEEEEPVHLKAKGQPHRPPQEEEIEDEEPEAQNPQQKVTSTPVAVSTASANQDAHSTMAKSHPDSVNSPVILKQSNILQSVPASRLHPQTEAPTRVTSPFTTTTTTTTEAASEAPSTRAPANRFRGQQRIRGGSTSEAAKVRQQLTTEQAVSDQADETVVKPSPTPAHRSFNKDSSRRVPSRRPQVESSQAAPESPVAQVPASSQDTPVRNAVRTRFPARTSSAPAVTTTPEAVIVSQSPSESPSVIVVQEANEQHAKENYVRSKSANDLFTFTRLQQAISSRAPARKDISGKGPLATNKFIVLGSSEQSTDAPTSSEATTFPPNNIEVVHSSEQIVPVTSTTTTTTTTTTTEAAPLDKFGKQRNRFGRTRRPLTGSANAETTVSPITEASASAVSRVPPQNRNRFSGRRKPSTPTPHTADETKQTEDVPSTSSTVSEVQKPRIPARNRFASRNRGQSSTTEVASPGPHDEEKKEASSSEPTIASTAPVRRNKPIFQGRRRNPNVGGHNATTPAGQDETASTSSPVTLVKIGDDHEIKRPGGLPNIQRRRPGAGAGPRIRGGRLGASTTTTTEAAVPASNGDSVQEQAADIEQSPTSQSEQLENVPAAVSSSAPSIVETTNQRGNAGVVGRLRTRSKLVTTTTTAAPEPAIRERKPSRLNGILNRRKPGVPLTVSTTTPAKEESKVEAQEEASNNAKEQEDSQHKGVVVQVSSSITESEELKQEHEEESEQSSTTSGSILNRLKSHRKPGSIFRKRTDPHGE